MDKKSRRNLIILAVIMGVVWMSLLFSQLRMSRLVFSSNREVFRSKLEMAAIQSLKTLDRMSFKIFFHGERFKEWYLRMNGENLTHTIDSPIDTTYRFLQNLEGINVKVSFLSRFVEQTHSCFDYRLLGYKVVDSVISTTLHNYNIYEPFQFGFYCAETEDFYFMSHGVDPDLLLDHGFKYSVLCINEKGKILSDGLYLYFPSLENRFQRDIVQAYIVIVLLLLVEVGALGLMALGTFLLVAVGRRLSYASEFTLMNAYGAAEVRGVRSLLVWIVGSMFVILSTRKCFMRQAEASQASR